MKGLRALGIACIVLACLRAGHLFADEPSIGIHKIDEKLYVLLGGSGQGAHVGLRIGDEGLLLIDSMHAHSHEKLVAAIRSISDKPVRYVIATHEDADHIGGSAAFAAMGATVISHANTRYSDAFGQLRVDGDFTLEFDGEDIQVRHVVAHSFADLLIYFPDRDTLFLGDTFTNNYHPYAFARGLDSELAANDLARSLAGPDTVIVPGHGYVDGRDGLDRYRRNVVAWYERVGELAGNDAALAEMLADRKLASLRDEFVKDRVPPVLPNDRYERFLHRTLSSQFVPAQAMPMDVLQSYEGAYCMPDGRVIEVLWTPAGLMARMRGGFIEELLPIAEQTFHIRTSLGGRYRFDATASGEVSSLTRSVGDLRIEASRSANCRGRN